LMLNQHVSLRGTRTTLAPQETDRLHGRRTEGRSNIAHPCAQAYSVPSGSPRAAKRMPAESTSWFPAPAQSGRPWRGRGRGTPFPVALRHAASTPAVSSAETACRTLSTAPDGSRVVRHVAFVMRPAPERIPHVAFVVALALPLAAALAAPAAAQDRRPSRSAPTAPDFTLPAARVRRAQGPGSFERFQRKTVVLPSSTRREPRAERSKCMRTVTSTHSCFNDGRNVVLIGISADPVEALASWPRTTSSRSCSRATRVRDRQDVRRPQPKSGSTTATSSWWVGREIAYRMTPSGDRSTGIQGPAGAIDRITPKRRGRVDGLAPTTCRGAPSRRPAPRGARVADLPYLSSTTMYD